MRYYQCDKYPIEFVLSENINKHFDSHNHARHYVISMVIQGVVTAYIENKGIVCRKGDAFVIPPYSMHSVRQGKNTCLLSMCIGTDFIEENDIEAAESIFQELLQRAVEQNIFGREPRMKLLTSVRKVYNLRDNGRKKMDASIKILVDRITSHPEQRLPVETLAADIFVSKYYLIRKFKNSIGMTPHHFCIQSRIRKSQGLLDEEKTISRVAVEMGFYDQSHFDKAFQRIVGIPPLEYIHSKNKIVQGI